MSHVITAQPTSNPLYETTKLGVEMNILTNEIVPNHHGINTPSVSDQDIDTPTIEVEDEKLSHERNESCICVSGDGGSCFNICASDCCGEAGGIDNGDGDTGCCGDDCCGDVGCGDSGCDIGWCADFLGCCFACLECWVGCAECCSACSDCNVN